MRTGRPPKSVAEHVANGTYRPSKHGPRPSAKYSAVATKSSATATPPKWLSADLRAEWSKIITRLGSQLEETDLSQLNAGFEALVCASKIRVVLDQAITDGDAAAIAKLSSAVSSQAGLARRLLEPFGSDPVSRAYIAKNAPKPKDDDDWEY